MATAALNGHGAASLRADLLFRSFRASNGRLPRVVARIKRIYDVVWPCDQSDPDLQTFASFLYLAVRVFRPRVVIQTGTAVGTSTMALAFGLRDAGGGHLYTIDPEPDSYMGVAHPVAHARAAVEHAKLGSLVTFVRGYSTLALDAGRIALPKEAPKWCLPRISRRSPADLIVVDGDHTFLGCHLDLVHGEAGLATDGPRILICHDYLGILEVRRAVQVWRESREPRFERVIPSPCGIKFLQL